MNTTLYLPFSIYHFPFISFIIDHSLNIEHLSDLLIERQRRGL